MSGLDLDAVDSRARLAQLDGPASCLGLAEDVRALVARVRELEGNVTRAGRWLNRITDSVEAAEDVDVDTQGALVVSLDALGYLMRGEPVP